MGDRRRARETVEDNGLDCTLTWLQSPPMTSRSFFILPVPILNRIYDQKIILVIRCNSFSYFIYRHRHRHRVYMNMNVNNRK